MKIVKSLKDAGLLIKGPTFETETKKNGGFLGIFLVILGLVLSRNMLASKCVIRACDGFIWAGDGVIRAGTETIRVAARFGTKTGFLILSHPLTNFEI